MVKALIPETAKKGSHSLRPQEMLVTLEVSRQRTSNDFRDGKSRHVTKLGLGQTGQNARQIAAFVNPREGGVQVFGRFVSRDMNELLSRELLRAFNHGIHWDDWALTETETAAETDGDYTRK